tara:strand:- start:629 stop:811 length:183 start_codon:yes stop_codon:yes gene_type:complete
MENISLQIKKGTMAEYLIPERPEYLELILLRNKIFKVKDLQELLDYVQNRIVKIEKDRLR